MLFIFFFFFSSRRRHTRFDCDWSSDVCSSDLSRAAARQCGSEPQPLTRNAGLDLGTDERPSLSRTLIRILCRRQGDRKSTRLNSSHSQISYAVFCLKKKKKRHNTPTTATAAHL